MKSAKKHGRFVTASFEMFHKLTLGRQVTPSWHVYMAKCDSSSFTHHINVIQIK